MSQALHLSRWRLWLADRLAWLRLRTDAWRFRALRADYYAYLAALLEAAEGRHTLRDVFVRDALRHGAATVRGRLSAHWAAACDAHAGDLAAVWGGTLPVEECMVVGAAQPAGAFALTQALSNLARVCALMQRARHEAGATLAAAAIALLVLLCTLAAVGHYTAPQLLRTFSAIPPTYFGASSRLLFGLADVVVRYGPLLLGLLLAALWAWLAAFPNLTHRWRRGLDGIGPWRLYRDLQATRFLTLLEVLLQQRGHLDTRLRTALLAQRPYARPWLGWHIDAMLARIERGEVGASTFDTGLFDRRMGWFLSDMALAHGLEPALRQARARVESHLLPSVARQAGALRWGVLLSVAGMMVALVLWHYQVIDELRRALVQVYASY
ncbi:pilus assembly protein [Bordetella genomosp. 1]|uniref:Pilus assembly protein n=1 Tax=Bordetella genomosp. 1 TaxID=1395607 RepID=A0A261SHN7_9BORD|nr:hypothetical protein [Bordetella genomosp. 1]OZI36462.1 pilus assembly protein [Bordetella genomosp. 1]